MERFSNEIKMGSSHRDTESGLLGIGQENIDLSNGLKTKITKKDSRSAFDLSDTGNLSLYMVTGAIYIQRQIPDFLTGRIHSQLNIEGQELADFVSMDTTPEQESEAPETPRGPINRLADVLVNLQIKPQAITIRAVTTNPTTFNSKNANFDLFEDLLHTMIKMQPAKLNK